MPLSLSFLIELDLAAGKFELLTRYLGRAQFLLYYTRLLLLLLLKLLRLLGQDALSSSVVGPSVEL